ncbi:MAG: N-6 DNA methylase [Chloroflexota bacterium]|nr:N-6 DNA methylase [Chloroflexota bacterium]
MSQASVSAHQRAYGQFFTPEPVVACCYQLCAGTLPVMPQIVDPACGDGAFLRYAVAHAITECDRVNGCDLDSTLTDALATAGLSRIHQADGLAPTSLPAGSFDLVIGNPPYGVGGTHNGGTAPASEVRFLLRALELARPGGLVALVLPSGVLANQRLLALRTGLLTRHTLLAIIALPRATFRHTGTSAACSIVLLRNAPALPDHLVFFAAPAQLDELPSVVAEYHSRLRIADDETESTIYNLQSTISGSFRLPQTAELARRLDASFWQPNQHALRDRLAARHPLRPLGKLIHRRWNSAPSASLGGIEGQGQIIPGDHVRPSRGELKGPGLPYEYYQTREFLPTGYNYAAIEHCDERAYRRLRRTAVQRHDILVSCAGMGGAGRGRACLITHAPGLSCTGDVLILRVQQPNPIFVYLFLISQAGRAQLLRLQNGVGTANLSVDELLQVEIPLLADTAQHNLAARYAPIAAAHAAAMTAALSGDQSAYARELARAEALLAQLVQEVDALLFA